MEDDYSGLVSAELSKCKASVESNWTDVFGCKCAQWMEQILDDVESLNRRKQVICLKCEKITALCKAMQDETGDDVSLVRKRR